MTAVAKPLGIIVSVFRARVHLVHDGVNPLAVSALAKDRQILAKSLPQAAKSAFQTGSGDPF